MSFKSLATGGTLVATGFVLGAVYSNWAYDYYLLWTHPTPLEMVDAALAHYKIKASQPIFLHHVLHAVFFLGCFGLIVKLYRPSESNTLFDGGSLILFVIGIIFYLTNLRPAAFSVVSGNWVDIDAETGVKFMAASQVFIVIALFGVLSLQFGQWWAEADTPQPIEYVATAPGTGAPGTPVELEVTEVETEAVVSSSAAPTGAKKRKGK